MSIQFHNLNGFNKVGFSEFRVDIHHLWSIYEETVSWESWWQWWCVCAYVSVCVSGFFSIHPTDIGGGAGAGLVAKSYLTLVTPWSGLPVTSAHGISQARILEWVAISFSRRSSQPRERNQFSCIAGSLLHCQQILCWLNHQGSPTTDIWGWVILCQGSRTVLCTVGCLVVLLTNTHWMPGPPLSVVTIKYYILWPHFSDCCIQRWNLH